MTVRAPWVTGSPVRRVGVGHEDQRIRQLAGVVEAQHAAVCAEQESPGRLGARVLGYGLT
jgi:hypothetical protein